jgi:hypothetical protein
MPLDNEYTQKLNGLAAQATAALHRRDVSQAHGAESADTPRSGNTGGTLRQSADIVRENQTNQGDPEKALPQTTPPKSAGRKSRAKETKDDMSQFLKLWFFDWLSLTIPNGVDGKGTKAEGLRGERENEEASKRLFTWATLQGLHVQRIGKGTDKYLGAAHMAFQPTDKDRVASIRDGHSKNMPNIELTGADGRCAELAPLALHELGPVLIARADSSWDVSQAGLFDDLYELLCKMSVKHGMAAPRVEGTDEAGRTIYFGEGEASVKIYEKSFERLAKGKIEEADLDENLVRIEFTFRPKKGKKAGLAKIANEHGAGALLTTTRWVRKLTEKIAVMTKQAREDQAELAVGRVTETPDVRRPQEMAKAAVQQYRRTLCNGAISQIVQDDWEGDWRAALVDPELVVDRVCDMVRDEIEATAYDLCEQHGVLSVKSLEDEADRQKSLLDVWMTEQRKRTDTAILKLTMAARAARTECGVREPEAA